MQAKTAFFKQRSSIKTTILFYTIFCALLIYTDAKFNYLEMIRAGMSIAIHPLRTVALIPAKMYQNFTEFIITTKNLKQENSRLKEEMFNTDKLRLVQDSLLIENKNLRKLLQLGETVQPSHLVAEIIYYPRDPFSREVVVDKGASNGVSLGAPAIDASGVIGQVVRLHPWTSEISLVTNRDHPVPVQVSRNGLRAVVFGVGYDSSLEVRFMPIDADIKQGDLLATSGIGGVYPANLPVGTVTKVDRDESYPFAKIVVKPVANIGKHRQLLLLSKNENFPPRPDGTRVEKEDK